MNPTIDAANDTLASLARSKELAEKAIHAAKTMRQRGRWSMGRWACKQAIPVELVIVAMRSERLSRATEEAARAA